MCDRSDDPTQHDRAITPNEREALRVLHLTDDIRDLTRDLRADRLRLRATNLRSLGFTEDEAWRLARASWRAAGGDAA